MYGEHEDLLERYKAAHKSGFKVIILELMNKRCFKYKLSDCLCALLVTDLTNKQTSDKNQNLI